MSVQRVELQTRLLAAIAYGEASPMNDLLEMGGIAFAVANRCRSWGGKTVTALKLADPNYAYAWDGNNARYNRFMKAEEVAIRKDAGMSMALACAVQALTPNGADPSNGAMWWDGVDLKANYANHPKVRDGFRFGDPSHNIFGVAESKKLISVRWKIRNRKTGQVVDGAERGRYEAVWVSTAAHGSTIFWKHPADYLAATGGKAYR